MVREYGPFRERFQEYILERTANHPALVPMIMHGQGKARFRLACKETVQAKNLLFPWHKDDEGLCQLFDRLCDEGSESVEGELDRRSGT